MAANKKAQIPNIITLFAKMRLLMVPRIFRALLMLSSAGKSTQNSAIHISNGCYMLSNQEQ
jgi:hypothetical protein